MSELRPEIKHAPGPHPPLPIRVPRSGTEVGPAAAFSMPFAAGEDAPPPTPLPAPRSPAAPPPAVALRGAAAAVAGKQVWSGVNITLERGSFTAVLGPNGAGKSTLIKALLGVVPLTAGSASVLGQPPGEVGGAVGYLPQRRGFDPALRIRGRDIVQLGLDGDRWGVPIPGLGRVSARRRAEAAQVDRVITEVDALRYADRPIGQLSGGEQQRLLIAQALVRRPDLLLLDEPLDSLDLPNQGAVAALIQRICQELGVTVLLVAHDVNPILPYLDEVVYIAHGGAVAGTPQSVITSETLSRLYDTPIEVLGCGDGRLVVVGSPEAPFVHGERHGHPATGGRPGGAGGAA
jgi:zinc/manganese transport system ATP-binding protein